MFSRVRRFFRRGEVDMTERREKEEAGLSAESNEGRRRWPWRMWRVGRRTSSPASVLMKKLAKREEERLTEGLQLITQKGKEERDQLILLTEEASIKKRSFPRLNPQYEVLKYKEKVMSFLHNLEMDTLKAHETKQQLKKEINFYSNLQNRIVTEKNLVQQHLDTLNQAVYIDFRVVQKYLLDFNPNDKEEQEKTSNLQTQHHQVSETARGLKLATSQKEHPLQDELPPSQENEILTEQELEILTEQENEVLTEQKELEILTEQENEVLTEQEELEILTEQENEVLTEQEELEILTEQENEVLTEQQELEILTEQENEVLTEQEELLAMNQSLHNQIASEKEKINSLRAEISEIQSCQQHGQSEMEEYSSDTESDSKDEEELQIILEDLQRENEELVIKNDHLNQAVHEEREAIIGLRVQLQLLQMQGAMSEQQLQEEEEPERQEGTAPLPQ
ncbi:uncharacterized protein LOC143433951 [Arvicanthis niloticus]|uniref:uncharacterized protein LOC143433951 n=1 Tax=Arvicanthis niloticus TaxID=61156 RepID=UPI00403C0A14